MAKYTENFNLIKPEDDEYYDVADFNENMDIIDEALAKNEGSSDKIGLPEDTVPNTVFGKLNGFISSDGMGVRIIKSIQWQAASISGTTSASKDYALNTLVEPSRCIVLPYRLFDNSGYIGGFSFSLSSDTLHVDFNGKTPSSIVNIGFWIIEFY